MRILLSSRIAASVVLLLVLCGCNSQSSSVILPPVGLSLSGVIDKSCGVAPNYKLLPLPYATKTALQPAISAETLEYHHGKHVQAYVDKANALTAEAVGYHGKSLGEAIQGAPPGPLLNQLLQIWNHAFYFQCMHRPDTHPRCAKSDSSDDDTSSGGGCESAHSSSTNVPGGPSAELLSLIKSSPYGSVEGLRSQFLAAADSHFGSGFTWLVVNYDNNKLAVYNSVNAGNPVKDGSGFPLIGMDIWEHSYYIDYRNRRAAYTSAFWDLLDWSFVNEMYAQHLVGGAIPFLH
eukprot:Lankesteria_metandrocarpae@DN4085_c1_g1_i1.p1